ncbi:MAG: potassium channel family protein [Acidobacteriia bacterium]|nr:potassium channel family protein [Terriglobia bacterium]
MTDDELKTVRVKLLANVEQIHTQLRAVSSQIEKIAPAPNPDSGLCLGRKHPENLVQLLIAFVLGVTGLIALLCWLPCMGAITVIGVNVYVIVLLAEVALRKGLNEPKFFELAHRAYFVLIVGILVTAMVCSFGSLYLDAGDVCSKTGPLSTRLDAAYFSAVTLTTVGFGDFAPVTAVSRWLVMWELASGFLSLLMIVPMLASRLALLGERH